MHSQYLSQKDNFLTTLTETVRNKQVLSFLRKITFERISWMFLILVGLFLEISALFFQHVMGLHPCVMCIYERIATLGMISAGVIGFINPRNAMLRWTGILLWGFSSYQGLRLSVKHVDYLLYPSPFNTCSMSPEFPDWLPLHEWMPWFFNPSADCSERQWAFLGWELPQWLVFIFVISLLIWTLIFIANLLARKTDQPPR